MMANTTILLGSRASLHVYNRPARPAPAAPLAANSLLIKVLVYLQQQQPKVRGHFIQDLQLLRDFHLKCER